MSDEIEAFRPRLAPTPAEPLLGLTVLVVEDSRYASEALRLLCLRSGARIRRADSLRAAARHLSTYRPSIAIIDLGLPDGSGLDLISRLHAITPRLPAILATSGDATLAAAARAAGADGFLPKPVDDLASFQRIVQTALPSRIRVATFSEDATPLVPDRLALQEDLVLAHAALHEAERINYAARFLASVARSSRDDELREAATNLMGVSPSDAARQVASVRALVGDRLLRASGA